ncbi:MAG TPA: DNA polymerase III subunit chi [Sedimenticola sp.]|nr:DNA polymerase III subunit chi [Sedimenticola sp.]
MTRVDFYILGERAGGDRFLLACRLAEKAWGLGNRVYLHTGSSAEARHLDRLLWSFRQGNFLPHGLAGECDPGLNPILVGHGDDPGEEHGVLINLCHQVPPFFSRFERLAEPIDRDPEVRQAGRERFRFYRDRGYPLDSHEIPR